MFIILEIIILKGNSIYWLLKDKTDFFLDLWDFSL